MPDKIIKTVLIATIFCTDTIFCNAPETWFEFLLHYIGFSSNCFGIIGDTYIISSSKSILLNIYIEYIYNIYIIE